MTRYEIFITPRAWRELKDLPGHMRQRIRREIDSLGMTPHPPDSSALRLPHAEDEAEALPAQELRRLRVDRWRIIYMITEEPGIIDILAIRKRPPYDYGDLAELIQDL